MHDAMAFKNMDTGFNYTLEWYELVELFNCTFAHVLKNNSMLWCNQGAACVYDGVDDNHWLQYGTLAEVAEITGKFLYPLRHIILAISPYMLMALEWLERETPHAYRMVGGIGICSPLNS